MSVLIQLRWFLWAVVGLALITTAHAQTTSDGVLINADNMDRDMAKGLVRLNGHVQLVFKGQHLSCDQAEINQKTETVTAEGNVILSNERVHVEGSRIVFNYKQNTGFIYNGFVQSGQVVFEGDVIEKVEESHYIANNAEYTACDTCPPGWSFSGKQIDAEIGGYARIKRPVFKVGGVPILILPSLIVPLKSARQSGFLVPSLDFSGRGGFALSESYFWAIDRSQDLTATVRWYEKRGVKLHEDYRYVLSETSKGRLQSAWMKDRALGSEIQIDRKIDRWFIDYQHHFEMPEKFTHRVNLSQVSDLRYPRDFTEELKGHGDPALENKTSITKATDNHYGSAEVDIYTNLLKDNPLAPNDDSVHRFPELRYGYKEHQLFEGGPYFALDVDYVNFARGKYNYDDLRLNADGTRRGIAPNGSRGVGPNGEIARDGRFDVLPCTAPCNRDLNRTGQRVDLRPTLSYPFQIARKFDVLPSVQFRETQYKFYESGEDRFAPTAARRYVQADLRVKTEMARIYGDQSDPNARRWKHSIEPEIGYTQIPWMRRPDHPFFGAFQSLKYSRQYEPLSDGDLTNQNTGIQFDYEDRTYERQAVDLVLTNRLTRKTFLNGEPSYFTAVLFRLSQSYDLNEARSRASADRPEPHPWSPINALLNMRFERFETYTTAIYNPYANVTNTSARVRFMTSPRDFLQVAYTRNVLIDERDIVQQNTETRNVGVGGGLNLKYFDFAGQLDWSDLTHQVQSWSYLLNIRPPGHCWVITIDHKQVLGGDRQIKGSFSFDFGGENKRGMFN